MTPDLPIRATRTDLRHSGARPTPVPILRRVYHVPQLVDAQGVVLDDEFVIVAMSLCEAVEVVIARHKLKKIKIVHRPMPEVAMLIAEEP